MQTQTFGKGDSTNGFEKQVPDWARLDKFRTKPKRARVGRTVSDGTASCPIRVCESVRAALLTLGRGTFACWDFGFEGNMSASGAASCAGEGSGYLYSSS